MRQLAVVALGVLLAVPAAAEPPTVAGCDVFPADNVWNARVDWLPVHDMSGVWIPAIGSNAGFHADFGSGVWPPGSDSPIGIPWVHVPGSQPEVEIVYTEAGDESDPGPFPIPPDAPIEGGPDGDGDRHVLVIDRDACVLYELYDAHKQPDDDWEAYSGAMFDLGSNALRPETWTSADAAGLPIFPGLVRYEEVASGEIRHALRFTTLPTFEAYVWPARHQAGGTNSAYPPMGARFRLRRDYPTAGLPHDARVIAEAMKRYGIILADNGSDWYVTGAPSESWDNDVLHELDVITGDDFEAVDTSIMTSDTDSARVELFFADGFESGDTAVWSATVP